MTPTSTRSRRAGTPQEEQFQRTAYIPNLQAQIDLSNHFLFNNTYLSADKYLMALHMTVWWHTVCVPLILKSSTTYPKSIWHWSGGDCSRNSTIKPHTWIKPYAWIKPYEWFKPQGKGEDKTTTADPRRGIGVNEGVYWRFGELSCP